MIVFHILVSVSDSFVAWLLYLHAVIFLLAFGVKG